MRQKTSQKKKSSICNVNISNRDLARIVNGFSNDPIELRPFDNCFTEAKIVKTWIAVGFLPMTGNAANDPKVGYELGEGGAPEEARVRMESLVDDYSEVAEELTNSGFNGNILNLASRQVSHETFPEDEEAQIEHIIKNKGMTKAGKLYKAGIIMANSRVVLEAHRRSALLAEKERDEAVQKKKDKEQQYILEAVDAFHRWVAQGQQITNDAGFSYPVLVRKDAVAIVRALLPRIDILGQLKMKEFSTAKACIKWLGEIGRGTTWDVEMRTLEMIESEGGDGQ